MVLLACSYYVDFSALLWMLHFLEVVIVMRRKDEVKSQLSELSDFRFAILLCVYYFGERVA